MVPTSNAEGRAMGFKVQHVVAEQGFQVVDDTTGRVFQGRMPYAEARELVTFLTNGPPIPATHPSGWRLYDADLQIQGTRRYEPYNFYARDYVAAMAYAKRCASDLEVVLDRKVTVRDVRIARATVWTPTPVAVVA